MTSIKNLSMEELLQKPLCMMNGEEFAFFLNNLHFIQKNVAAEVVDDAPNTKHLVYGISGIAQLFNCSIPTASRIKSSGVINDAITQVKRKIVVDADKALELAQAAGTHRIASIGYDDLGRFISRRRPGKAGEETYGYDLHGWTTTITAGRFTERLAYANPTTGVPRYNGDISQLAWSRDSTQLCGYKLSYDALGRMPRAEYGEGSGLSDKVGRYDERITGYDANGNIMGLVRNGRRQDGSYGSIDELTITRRGNRLQKVIDRAPRLVSKGSFDFNDDDNNVEEEYTFNADGAMTGDLNKGIALIEYDDNNCPRRIQFTNGCVTEYVYSASGRKLRAVHYKAMPNITVPMGERHDLTRRETLSKDSTDYLGSLVLINGRAKRYLYPGGYCQVGYIDEPSDVDPGQPDPFRPLLPIAPSKAITQGVFTPPTDSSAIIDRNKITSMAFMYYNRDHLGNVRQVVDEEGKVRQSLDYYPFGTPYSDATAKNVNMQPYKYNGKELDRTHGLDTYDYGARQYDPVLAQWTSVDPMAEKYYPLSSYTYCLGNPVRHIDPNGKSTWVYMTGNYTYEVFGGNLMDDARNIYVYHKNKKGILTRGSSIGITPTTTSFYDSKKRTWVRSIINMTNDSGIKFLNHFKIHQAFSYYNILEYIYNARGNHKYDFKVTDGNSFVVSSELSYAYRGMPIGRATWGNYKGKKVIASARDIGNMAAGIVSAKNGLPYSLARLGFDTYQSWQDFHKSNKIEFHIEEQSTRNAEFYGYFTEILGNYY